MFGSKHVEEKITIPCYKDCNRFLYKVDGKIVTETLLGWVREGETS